MRISNPGKQANRITDLTFTVLPRNTRVSSSGPGLSHTAPLYPSVLWGSHKTVAQSPSHHMTVGMSLAPQSQFPATALFPLPPHSVLQPVIKGGRKTKRENTKLESDRNSKCEPPPGTGPDSHTESNIHTWKKTGQRWVIGSQTSYPHAGDLRRGPLLKRAQKQCS